MNKHIMSLALASVLTTITLTTGCSRLTDAMGPHAGGEAVSLAKSEAALNQAKRSAMETVQKSEERVDRIEDAAKKAAQRTATTQDHEDLKSAVRAFRKSLPMLEQNRAEMETAVNQLEADLDQVLQRAETFVGKMTEADPKADAERQLASLRRKKEARLIAAKRGLKALDEALVSARNVENVSEFLSAAALAESTLAKLDTLNSQMLEAAGRYRAESAKVMAELSMGAQAS